MKTNVKNQKEIKELASNIAFKLRDNLLSILIYGSIIRNPSETSDIDIIIILKDKKDILRDINILKEVIVKVQKEVDIQLLYNAELKKGDLFSLDTHGAFIIEELKNAIPLYGDNPFLKIKISENICKASIIQKLQYYSFRARQASLGYSISTKDKNSDFHRKKINMAMLDLLIAKQIQLKKSEKILNVFNLNYPEVITDEFKSILSRPKSLEPEEALPIYEKLYEKALSWEKDIYQYKQKPKIAKKEGIFFEYLLPKGRENIPFIILCEGLPHVPYQRDFINKLAYLGYGVVYPRYHGIWESGGVFLERPPSEEISYLATQIKKGAIFEEKNIKASAISLIGTSFGASVALSLANDKEIDKIIALSPVLDFKKFRELESLKKFLKEVYSEVYRFSDKSWEKLKKGEAVPSSLAVTKSSAHKIFLFGGGKDKEISPQELLSWGKQQNIKTKIYPEVGHLSFSKVEGELFEDIIKILNPLL